MIFFQAPPTPVAALVERVVANVEHYHQVIPSITADEDITSSLSQHGLYRAKGKAYAMLRVTRSAVGLVETRTYLVLDGKAVPAGKKVQVPFELNGAFSRIADTFFAANRVGCYSFLELPEAAQDGSIQLTFTTNATLPEGCPNKGREVRGLVRVDPVTAEIRHLEQMLVSETVEESHALTFIAIDYAPAELGSQTLWLPTLLKAEVDKGKGTFVARYSAYRRYASTVKIVPGGETTP